MRAERLKREVFLRFVPPARLLAAPVCFSRRGQRKVTNFRAPERPQAVLASLSHAGYEAR